MRAYWVLLRVGVVCLLWSSAGSSLWAQTWFGHPYSSIGGVVSAPAPGATTGSSAPNLVVTANDNAGPPAPPTAPAPPGGNTVQGWAQVTSGGFSWARVEGLFPPVSGSANQLSNAPSFIATDQPPNNYLLAGSSFSTSMTAQDGSWPIVSLNQNASFASRSSPLTPMRIGLVLTTVGGDTPVANTVYVNNGSPAASGVWTPYNPFSGSAISTAVNLYLAGFALPSTASSETVFSFQSLFFPGGLGGGEFHLFQNLVQGDPLLLGDTAGDPWALFSGNTTVSSGGSISISQAGGGDGLSGILEFLGDLTVNSGGNVSAFCADSGAYNTTILNGPSHLFTGPGTFDLGQIMVESADWQLVNATVQANQGGPSTQTTPWPAILFYPSTSTTLDANSQLTSPDNMELRTQAVLAGLGRVSAQGGFASNGRIQPGVSGQLGCLTFLAGTTLTCDASSEIYTVVTPAANSKLYLESAPNLGGTLTVSCLHGPGYKEGQIFTVVEAPSFNGDFATVSTPGSVVSAFLSLDYRETPTQKNMVVTRYARYDSTACTLNERLIAGALDATLATGCASEELIDALSMTIDSLARRDFSCGCVWDSVGGVEVLGLLQSGIANAVQLTRSVQWELWRAQDAWALCSRGSTGRIWGDGSFGQARWTGGSESLHLHSRGGFGILGGEAQIGDDALLGITAHYSPSHQRWDRLDSASKLWLVGGGLYAGWSQPDQWWINGGTWYATASAQFDYLRARLERTPLRAGPLFDNTCTSCLHGSTSGMTTTARLESGYRWNTALLMQPYVAIQGTWVHLNAFCEEGNPEDLPLRTWSNSAHESLLSPGLRLSSVWTSPKGHLVAPELVIEINQALGDRQDCAWVGFEGSPYLVNLQSADLPRTLLFLSGGLQTVWGRHLSGQLRVNLQKGSHFTASGVDIQLAVTF